MKDKVLLHLRLKEIRELLESDPVRVIAFGLAQASRRSQVAVQGSYVHRWHDLLSEGDVNKVMSGLRDPNDGFTSSHPFVGLK